MNKRLVSGMRSTGKLHIGHYKGALENWLKLQDEYDCFYFVADWHALTTKYMDLADLQNDILEMLADWLALGLDPLKTTIFKQSSVPQHAELALLLSFITPLSWLERCPTYKEQLKELSNKEISTLGFLGYPVLQTADIIMYNASYVPVGEDQQPHVELSREIVRRFNYLYANETFVEPQTLLTQTPRLIGVDGRKMSKSYNNSIYLSDSEPEITAKVRQMVTDPSRIKVSDPGHPEVCSVFYLHEIFNTEEVDEIKSHCKAGKIGCVACKKKLVKVLVEQFAEVKEKREDFLKNPSYLQDVLAQGSTQASKIAAETLEKVRNVMKV
ncbi:MAG: tryptophan--tRNA ligase [bacterium]|nr:tryptophan--tRNA ligase [bacterium]